MPGLQGGKAVDFPGGSGGKSQDSSNMLLTVVQFASEKLFASAVAAFLPSFLH